MEENLFDSIDEFYKKAQALSETSDGLLHECGSALGLGLDPFQLQIALHRQLQKLNENAFSDWLQWALLVACKHSKNPVRLCEELLSPELLEAEADEQLEYEMQLLSASSQSRKVTKVILAVWI